MSAKPHVVVVGAGVAGLQAAQTLTQSGVCDVTVLEASFHIGGRCRYVSEKDLKSAPKSHSFMPVVVQGVKVPLEDRLGNGKFDFEMGAEFVHGLQTSIYKLGEKRNWTMPQLFTWSQGDGGPSEHTSPDGGAGYYFVEGILYRFDELPGDIRQAHEVLWNMSEKTNDITDPTITAYSVLQKKGLSRRALALADAGYANTAGDSLRSLSWDMCCHAEAGFDADGEHDFRIEEGFTKMLVGALSEDLNIRVKHPVVKVEQVGSAMKVLCANGKSFDADYVIMAVPVPILQANHAEQIEFVPRLPDWKLDALNQVRGGNGFKVHVKLNRRVFPADLHGMVCAESMFPEIWMDSDGKGPLDPNAKYWYLTGFCMGSWADRCGVVQPDQLVNLFLDQLEQVFQCPDLRSYFCGGVIIDWSRVPYIRAGYTPATILEDRLTRTTLAKRTNNIFWAGEAMNVTQYTTANGAMDSGAVAAQGIIDEIARKPLSKL